MSERYTLDRRAADRLSDMLRRDRRRRHDPGMPGMLNPVKYWGSGGSGLYAIKVGADGITAAAWSGGTTYTPGEGAATLVSDGSSITVKSIFPGPIDALSVGYATKDSNGAYWIVVTSCTTVPA